MDTTPDLDFSPQIALSRRALMRRAAIAAAALPAGAALLEGLAGTAAAADSGQIVLNNYPGWIGKNELAAFSKKYPGDKVKMVTNATSSVAEVVLQFKSGNFDVLLSDTTDSGQADAAGLIEKLDWSKIPNIKNVSANFRKAYPWGIPTDYGKVGIAYRPDIVGETITSWHDLWQPGPEVLAASVVFIDLERDCIGSTLKYLGFSSNTTDAEADRRGARRPFRRSSRTCRRSSTRTSARAWSTARPRSRWTGTTTSRCCSRSTEDRVGAARGGHARLPRGLQRRKDTGQHRGHRGVPELPRSSPCSTPTSSTRPGTAYVCRRPRSLRQEVRSRPNPILDADARRPRRASSSTITSEPRARSSVDAHGKR